MSNNHLSHGNAQKFGVLIKVLYNEEISVAGAVMVNTDDTLE
jgi:hypothetical protein